MTKQDKEQRFEKVVDWGDLDPATFWVSAIFALMIMSILFPLTVIATWLTLLEDSLASKRKVYWRKVV